MVLQVALIALGVFLGLAGEEWREARENQRLAAETLQRFRTELTTNRAMVFSSRTYGVQALTNQLGAGLLNAMYAQPPKLAPEGFIGVLELYYDDLTDIEPQLLPAYDTLIAAIDEALAQ